MFCFMHSDSFQLSLISLPPPQVALSMVKNMVEHHTEIGEVEKVNKLYEVIGPLLRDGEGEADEGAGDEEDFAEEQRHAHARFCHIPTKYSNTLL